jgi:hypothetical protein
MSAAAGRHARRSGSHWPLTTGIAVLLGAEAMLALLSPAVPIKPLLRGWLLAFAIFSTVPIGGIIWLLIHRLTGGEWGLAAAPVLRPAAAITPLLLIAFSPVLLGLRDIYPWAADPSVVPADVVRWYLNVPWFALRSLIALAGWSLLALVFCIGAGSRLLAGLGLAFYGLTISFVAVDWYLSLEPRYVATAFAATIAIQQLLAALAVAVLVGPPAIEGKVADSLGGLLIATLLGVVYLEVMTFVVAWYGDLPDKAAWFIKRADASWLSVLITALLFGAVLPFGMLLAQTVRRSRRGLRIAAALILFGTTLHFAWLLVPAFDDQAGVIAAALFAVAVLALVLLLIGPALARWLEARDAE